MVFLFVNKFVCAFVCGKKLEKKRDYYKCRVNLCKVII
jgi:hypothetical protein